MDGGAPGAVLAVDGEGAGDTLGVQKGDGHGRLDVPRAQELGRHIQHFCSEGSIFICSDVFEDGQTAKRHECTGDIIICLNPRLAAL